METGVRSTGECLSAADLEARLRAVGASRYHHLHPFHARMHRGDLSRGQMQAWALNRYYYQSRIPMKDALIMAKSEDSTFRRAWRKRVIDHDGGDRDGDRAGTSGAAGGIEKWILLAEATGLDRERVMSCEGVLPGVRFAVDAYLALVREGSLLTAVASSLTEMFSRDLIALRMDRLREHYPYLQHALSYFEGRLTQARDDAAFALDYVKVHATTRELQDEAVAALERKCEILWAQLDAIDYAYVEPGRIPPGCFRPES